jgi:hypothetical protein
VGREDFVLAQQALHAELCESQTGL